jgi:rhodanese-related sulfurtransferase
MPIYNITPQEFRTRLAQEPDMKLIDVRTPIEYREVHIVGAQNVPLDQLDAKAFSSEETLYLICRSGGRGTKACEKLLSAGHQKVFNIDGGTMACVEAGLTVVRGKKMMSLERQVRIVAGSLVALGVLLSLLVHEGFIGLSAFVGCGLVFAGITDTCAMGMLIAKMPWNRLSPSSSTCAVT